VLAITRPESQIPTEFLVVGRDALIPMNFRSRTYPLEHEQQAHGGAGQRRRHPDHVGRLRRRALSCQLTMRSGSRYPLNFALTEKTRAPCAFLTWLLRAHNRAASSRYKLQAPYLGEPDQLAEVKASRDACSSLCLNCSKHSNAAARFVVRLLNPDHC